MDLARIKSFAKGKIKERFGNVLIITLISMIASAACSATYIGVILVPALTLSLLHVNIAFLAGRNAEIKDVFWGVNDWWSALKLNVLQSLYTTLWSLLFVIPGIVKSCAYSQSMYLLGLHKGKSARECLRESEELMKGHKMDYFKLQLSFIGWWLLVGVTFGIAAIWVVPYYNASMATFFIDIMPVDDDSEETTYTAAPSTPAAPHKPITFGQRDSDEENKGSNNRL